jgi:hypothetical protein
VYTPLDTVYIWIETFFVYVKMGELFEVAELGGTLCTNVITELNVLDNDDLPVFVKAFGEEKGVYMYMYVHVNTMRFLCFSKTYQIICTCCWMYQFKTC